MIKQNVKWLEELDSFAQEKKYKMKYRLGIENKRIGSDSILAEFSVLDNEFRQNAMEFFHSRYYKSKNLYDKYKYYSIFKFLSSKKPTRLLGCDWKEEGITINSCGDVFYCAVASEKIGSLRQESGEHIFFKEKNIKYRESIINDDCNRCIHDYFGRPELKNLLKFFRNIFYDKYQYDLFRLRSKFL